MKLIKKMLREEYLNKRKKITENERMIKSLKIVKNIQALSEFTQSKTIALFYPIQEEVSLLNLLKDKERRYCFPKIIDFKNTEMAFCLSGEKFVSGRFNLQEPTGALIKKEEIDIIICPGVAFSYQGERLGYGKGFYDYYLQTYLGVTIGVAFKEQIAKNIPQSPVDQLMNIIITDEEVICIQR